MTNPFLQTHDERGPRFRSSSSAMRLSRFATFWEAEGEVEQVPDASPLLKYIYQRLRLEPFNAVVPQDARPYCCYLDTVYFYDRRTGEEIASCHHYNLAAAPSPHLLRLGGVWYEVGSGQVLWRNNSWQFRWTIDARTRLATLANSWKTT